MIPYKQNRNNKPLFPSYITNLRRDTRALAGEYIKLNRKMKIKGVRIRSVNERHFCNWIINGRWPRERASCRENYRNKQHERTDTTKWQTQFNFINFHQSPSALSWEQLQGTQLPLRGLTFEVIKPHHIKSDPTLHLGLERIAVAVIESATLDHKT